MGSFVRGVKCCSIVVLVRLAAAQSGIITTVAGTAGARGFGGMASGDCGVARTGEPHE
jgi:hypothetical protein